MMKIFLSVILIIELFLITENNAFEVPEITLKVLRPRGFQVSIPDEEGIKLFAFHGKVNEEMNGREGGIFSRDVTKAKNGRWTFSEPNAKLNVGDVLYYWTYVDYFDGTNTLGYVNDDKSIVVQAEHVVNNELESSTIENTSKKTTKVPRTTTKRCDLSLTTSKGRRKCKGALIFSDQFKSLDPNKWKTELRFAGEPDYEFVAYTDNPQVINVDAGKLQITPKLSEDIFSEDFVTSPDEFDFGDGCTGELGTADCVQNAEAYIIKPPVASAQISTKDSFYFKYGKVDIKARLPKGDWIYPEIYLNSKNEDYGPYYESGQIRIAFCQGNSGYNNILYGGCVLGNSNLARSHFMKSTKKSNNRTWTDDFHVFSILWTDEKLVLSVDGKKYGTIFAPEEGFASLKDDLDLKGTSRWGKSDSAMAPFDQEMYLTIGVGVGGHNFVDRKSKPWVNNDPKSQKNFYKHKNAWFNTWNRLSSLEVEYIKVYALES